MTSPWVEHRYERGIHMRIYMHADLHADMRIDLRMDMCMDMHRNMCSDTRAKRGVPAYWLWHIRYGILVMVY